MRILVLKYKFIALTYVKEIERLRTLGFGSKPFGTDPAVIEEFPLEPMLTLMIDELKYQVESTTEILGTCSVAVDETSELIVKMINSAEVLQMHLEFTLSVLESNSQEQVQGVKERFSLIRSHYENVETKDDFTPLTAKYAVATFHDKIVLESKELLKKCFKKDKYGEMQLIRNQSNLTLIQIISSRFEVGIWHFPMVITFAKDDIFNSPKNSELWQDLYKSAVFKKILTKQEIRASFKFLHLLSNLSHIISNRCAENKGLPGHKAVFNLVQDILYYGAQHSKAGTKALYHLIDPQVEQAFQAWNLVNHPVVSKLIALRLPMIGYDEQIFIPRLFPQITKGTILKEYQENTINKITPIDPKLLINLDLKASREEILKDLFVDGENKVPVRILAPDHLDLDACKATTIKGFLQKTTKALIGTCPKSSISSGEEGVLVIHLHGGGFVAMSSASMRILTRPWCKTLKMVHFSVDYRLAPKDPYPAALDDVWQAYLWILNYAESVLGIKNKKIILTGDSAGGNLALAIALRIVKAGLQAPQGIMMIYPCLEMDTNYSSPNVFSAIDDPMLHTSLLKLCTKAYIGEGFNALKDPFISPVVASDELLEKLPPVRIITGSADPLQDSNWRLVSKLKKLNKDVKIIVHEDLSHGFACHQDLKNFEKYIQEGCELIRELASINH